MIQVPFLEEDLPAMLDDQLRAKVFVSCGQIQGSEEVEIASRIADRLVQLGYDPYIATQEQTLRGVKENIFGQLESSEYFIFIDLKRERLVTNDSQFHRGSLFCHQELALASYLDIPLLAFQERGVMQQDGLMRFLQANSTPFSDRNLLPNVIADAVQQHEWDPRWKNQLCLERDFAQYVDATRIPENVPARYFHIRVRNLHPRKAALNCYAYLERVRDISAHRDIRVETIEFKWAGYTLPNAVIGAGSERRLDAFWVPHNAPNVLQFNVFADSTEFIPRIRGPGDFEMTYVVVSENFAPARRTFLLHVGTRLDEIHFRAPG
jgi:hypothetical protein